MKHPDFKVLAIVFMIYCVLVSMVMGYNRIKTYEGEQEVKDLKFCLQNRPMMNVTCYKDIDMINNPDCRISEKCYGEYWSIYCKYTYPEHCPK